MVIVQNVKLNLPEPHFGVELQPNKFDLKWFIITVLFVMLISANFVVPIIFQGHLEPVADIIFPTVIAGIAYTFYTSIVFSRNGYEFEDNVWVQAREWAHAELLPWLNTSYAMNFTEEEVEDLLLGGWGQRTTVRREVNGEIEYVDVFLVINEYFQQYVRSARYHMEAGNVMDWPNISRLDPKLMMIIRPQKTQVYEFTHD